MITRKIALALMPTLILVAANARAETVNVQCSHFANIPHHEDFVKLSAAQWQFARALFVASPLTPLALPPGDSVVLHRSANGEGLLLFIDGDEACAPMKLPSLVVDLFDEIGRGTINHAPGSM